VFGFNFFQISFPVTTRELDLFSGSYHSNAAAWNRQAQCPGPKIQKVGGAFAPKYKNVARNPKKLPLKLKKNQRI